MRWLRLNCILLTSLAILSATKAESSRHKRDLSYVRNLIKSAIFGRENKTDPKLVLVNSGENYKIFRIPGFNNVLVKAVPKVAGTVAIPDKVELVSPEDTKAGIVASYIGTKTQDETLNALQGVKALLSSGVLTATKDQAVPVGPLPAHLQLIAVGEGTFEKPHILLDTSTICDDEQPNEQPVVIQQPTIWQGHPFLSIFQRPIPFPTVFKPISPIKVPVPALPTKYSYKQFHGDGKVTTYTANDDQNVIVTQSDQPGPLPPAVSYRIQEVMKLGAHSMQGVATIPLFAGNIQRPIVQYFTSPKVNHYRPVVSPVGNNYSYKQIHNDGTVTSYSSSQKVGDVVVTEGGKVPAIPTFITQRIEKVAATAATGKQPNPVVLSGINVAQAQLLDITGGVQVNVDTKVQQPTQQNQPANTGSQGTYSYQTIHKDGSVTNYGVASSVATKPEKAEVKPISPLFIEDRLQTIAKTSGGSFSYKILHNDGTVTNYGVFGVHEGNNGGSKIVPVQKIKPETNQHANFIFGNKGQATQPEITDKGTAGYSYKRIHSDGLVTSYSSNGVDKKNGKGPDNQFRGDDLQMTYNGNLPLHINLNNQQNAERNLHDTQHTSNAVNYPESQHTSGDSKSSEHQNSFHAPKIGNPPSPGSFTYKAVHSDGSITIYSQNGVKEINKQQENMDQNKLQQSVIALGTSKQDKQNVQEKTQENAGVTFNNQDLTQNDQISNRNNIVPATSSFSYRAIHNDGSATIYSQNGVKEVNAPFKNENQPSSSAVSVKKPENNNQYIEGSARNYDLNHQAEKQNIHVSSENNIGSGYGPFSYKAIHNDGSATIYLHNGVKEKNGPLNSENQQSTIATGVNHEGNIQNLQLNALNNAAVVIEDQAKKQTIPVTSQNNAAPVPESFSYKAVHSDGSTTIYSQNGVKEENAALINKNQQPPGSTNIINGQENNQQSVRVQNIVVPVLGSFSYKAVHNDGSMTTYSQNGVKEENGALKNKNQQPSSVAGNNFHQEGKNQYLQASVPDDTGTAFNEQAVKQNIQVSVHNGTSGSFSYKTVHSDGSATIHSQHGVKEENAPLKIHNPQSSSSADVYQQIKNHNNHVNPQNIAVPVSTSFSYKAVHNDGSMTTYTQSGVKEETNAKESHTEENKDYDNQAVKSVNDVKLNMNEQHLHTNKQNKGTSSNSFSYKTVHSDGSETNYPGHDGIEIKYSSHNNPVNAPSHGNSRNKQDEVTEKIYVLTNLQYNVVPSGSFSHKTVHSDGSVSNMQSELSQQNVENRDQSSAALEDEQKTNQIIPPAPELPELSSNDLSVTPVGVLVADSNKILFTKPVVSSYTYKQINHHSPDQFKVAVNIGNAASTESEFKAAQVAAVASTNEAATVDTIPKDYVFIPPENVNEPLPIKPLVRKEERSTEKPNPPSVVVLAPVDVVPCVEKSLSEHPIVVLDEPMKYSYQQRKADGSAIHVESDQSVVSINISSKDRVRSRGDIPESP